MVPTTVKLSDKTKRKAVEIMSDVMKEEISYIYSYVYSTYQVLKIKIMLLNQILHIWKKLFQIQQPGIVQCWSSADKLYAKVMENPNDQWH